MDFVTDLREGMTVYSSDGKKLGRVVEKQAGAFLIEKGRLFRRDYLCDYDQIADIRGDDIHLKTTHKAKLSTPETMKRRASEMRASLGEQAPKPQHQDPHASAEVRRRFAQGAEHIESGYTKAKAALLEGDEETRKKVPRREEWTPARSEHVEERRASESQSEPPRGDEPLD